MYNALTLRSEYSKADDTNATLRSVKSAFQCTT